MSKLMDEILKMADKVNKQVADAKQTKKEAITNVGNAFIKFFEDFNGKYSEALVAALGTRLLPGMAIEEGFSDDNLRIVFEYNGIRMFYGIYQRNYRREQGVYLLVFNGDGKWIRIVKNENPKECQKPIGLDTSDYGNKHRYPEINDFTRDITKELEPFYTTLDKLLTKPRWKEIEAVISAELLKVLANRTSDADNTMSTYKKSA